MNTTKPGGPYYVHPLLDVLHGFVHISTFLRDSATAVEDDPKRQAVLQAQSVSYMTAASLVIQAIHRIEDDGSPELPSLMIGPGHVMGIAGVFCTAGRPPLPEQGDTCVHGNPVGAFHACPVGERLAGTFCRSILDWDGPLRPYALAAVNDPSKFQMAKLDTDGLSEPSQIEYQPDDDTVQRVISLPCHLGIEEGSTCLHGNPVPDDERPCELGFSTAEALTKAMSPGGPLNPTITFLLCGHIPEGLPLCSDPNCKGNHE